MKVESAQFVRSVVEPRGLVADDRGQVAFVGRSNVGKSSLLNRLLMRRSLARISSTPGRTRAINYFLINDRFYFVDLPGYGYARVSKRERAAWAGLMAEYLRESAARAMVIQIVDAKVGATDLDVQAFEYLRSLGQQPLVAATKIDRLPRGRVARVVGEIRRCLDLERRVRVLPVSARTGFGIGDLWSEIDHFIGAGTPRTIRGARDD